MIIVSSRSRKEKLNTEQYQSTQDNLSLPGAPHTNSSDTTTLHYQLIGPPSSPRTRNQHNSSEFQLQPNISRTRAMGISQTQPLSNDSIPQDLHYQTSISEFRNLEGAAQHVLSGLHNYCPMLHPIETRNTLLGEQEIHEHNFVTDCLSSYQNNQNIRGDEESEVQHSLKSQGTKVMGINKKKNPKTCKSGVSHSHSNCWATHDSAANTTDHKRQ